MTCVVGWIDKKYGEIFIGTDSSQVSEHHIRVRKDEKIAIHTIKQISPLQKHRDDEQMIIGFAGSFRVFNVLKYNFIPPTDKENDPHKYLCTDFINELRETLYDCGALNKNEGADIFDFSAVIGYKNRLWIIYEDFQVGEHNSEFICTGNGEQYATGACEILLSMEEFEIKDKIEVALDVAEKYCGSVRSPFVIKNI